MNIKSEENGQVRIRKMDGRGGAEKKEEERERGLEGRWRSRMRRRGGWMGIPFNPLTFS